MSSLKVGSKIKSCRIIEKISEGRDSIVWMGKDDEYGMVAVKCSAHPKTNTMLLNEIRVYKHLSPSPYWPKFYYHTKVKDTVVIIMELCATNLSEAVKQEEKETFGIRKGCLVGIEIVKAMKELHEQNIIHCDIKPNNFAFGIRPLWANYVKVLDFGESIHKDWGSFLWKGTSIYASLRVHDEEHYYGVKDDLWSMLYVIINLSTGLLPWKEPCDKLKKKPGKKRQRALEGKKNFESWIFDKATEDPNRNVATQSTVPAAFNKLPIEFAKMGQVILQNEDTSSVYNSWIHTLQQMVFKTVADEEKSTAMKLSLFVQINIIK